MYSVRKALTRTRNRFDLSVLRAWKVFGKDKPDYAGLAQARDELRSLTADNKRKFDALRREQSENKMRMDADLEKDVHPDDSSFLQCAGGRTNCSERIGAPDNA